MTEPVPPDCIIASRSARAGLSSEDSVLQYGPRIEIFVNEGSMLNRYHLEILGCVLGSDERAEQWRHAIPSEVNSYLFCLSQGISKEELGGKPSTEPGLIASALAQLPAEGEQKLAGPISVTSDITVDPEKEAEAHEMALANRLAFLSLRDELSKETGTPSPIISRPVGAAVSRLVERKAGARKKNKIRFAFEERDPGLATSSVPEEDPAETEEEEENEEDETGPQEESGGGGTFVERTAFDVSHVWCSHAIGSSFLLCLQKREEGRLGQGPRRAAARQRDTREGCVRDESFDPSSEILARRRTPGSPQVLQSGQEVEV